MENLKEKKIRGIYNLYLIMMINYMKYLRDL